MGSHGMNNSLQTAPLMSTPPTGDDDVANIPSTSWSGDSLEGLPARDASGEAGISLAIVSLITPTVQASLAAEHANTPPSLLATTPPIPSVSSPSVPSTTTSVCSGGVPPLLLSSTHALLIAGAGVAWPSLPGRPIQSMSPVVPSFVSTFSNVRFQLGEHVQFAIWCDSRCRRSSCCACFACHGSTFRRWPWVFACAGQAGCSNRGQPVRQLE